MDANVKTTTAATSADQKLLVEIQKCIAKPPATSRVFTITPGVALYLLETYNKENRPRKPAKIAEYRDDMLADQWGVTGDNLKFSDAGRLRDGQNRLIACFNAQKPFTTHIVFGIPDHLFDRMDRGKTRDGSDLLAIAQYKNTKQLAVAVRWIYLIDQGRVRSRDTLQSREILRLLEDQYPTLPEFCAPAARIWDTTRQPPGVVTALLYAFHRKDSAAADEFAARWAGGLYSGRYQPLRLLQEILMSMHQTTSGRVHEVVRAAYMVTAWNLVRDRRRGSKSDFNWSLGSGGDFPTIK